MSDREKSDLAGEISPQRHTAARELTQRDIWQDRCPVLLAKFDLLGEALEAITAIDRDDWMHGQGWECVEFIQIMARKALDAAS